MLKHRVIFGLLFSAIFIGLIWLDGWLSRGWPNAAGWSAPPGVVVAVGSLLIIPLALTEMRNLLKRENVQISLRITVIAAVLCMLWPWLEQIGEDLSPRRVAAKVMVMEQAAGGIVAGNESSPWYAIARWFKSVKPHYLVPTILTLSLVAAFVMHSRDRKVEGAMANAGGTLLAIVYLGVLPGFFLPICLTHSAWMMLAIVCVVKCADVGAYFTGRAIGKHKLIPWLSPGKTIEGFFGGLALSGLVGAGVAMLFLKFGDARWAGIPVSGAVVGGLIAGACLGAVGQLGDLLESLLKRDAGVKDSGILPGFGGVLDLLDSPLLAAPVAYWLLKLIMPTAGSAA